MHPLSFNDTDPLPLRLGATVGARKLELVPLGTVPAATYRIEPDVQHLLTADNRAWVQAYEATERDLAVRPKRFFNCCTSSDPLGRIVRRATGAVQPRNPLTDDEARAQMVRALAAEDPGDVACLAKMPIDEVYRLYACELQGRELERRELLLERIKQTKAQGSSVAEQLMDRVRAEYGLAPSPQRALVIEGQNVPMGPGTPPAIVIKNDPQESVWRVLGVRNDYATLERYDGAQRIVHIAQLAHDIQF